MKKEREREGARNKPPVTVVITANFPAAGASFLNEVNEDVKSNQKRVSRFGVFFFVVVTFFVRYSPRGGQLKLY